MDDKYHPYDRIRATFRPKRCDNLQPGAAELIGERLEFRGGWELEAGHEYAGQIAWMPSTQLALALCMGWVPTEDLENIELLVRGTGSWRPLDEYCRLRDRMLASMRIHLDASLPASFSRNERGQMVWHDWSGNGRDLVSPTGHQPVYVSSEPKLVGAMPGRHSIGVDPAVGPDKTLTLLRVPSVFDPDPRFTDEELEEVKEGLKKLGLEEPKVAYKDGQKIFIWDRQLTHEEIKAVEWYMRRKFNIPASEPARMISKAEMARIERSVKERLFLSTEEHAELQRAVAEPPIGVDELQHAADDEDDGCE